MIANIYKSTVTGVLYLSRYTPRTNLLRGGEYDGSLYNFKQAGTGADRYRQIVQGVRELHDCQTVVAIPAHDESINSVQALTDGPVRLRGRYSRPTRHNDQDLPLDEAVERDRVSITGRPDKPFDRVLLVDDVCTTGTTMKLYAQLLVQWGVAHEVVTFALAHRECRHERVGAVVLVDPPAPVVQVPDKRPHRPLDDILADWLLREGIVDGQRLTLDEIAEDEGVTVARAKQRLGRVRSALLQRYDLAGGDGDVALELVKSVEAVRRASGDLELVLHGLRQRLRAVEGEAAEAVLGELRAAVDAQAKLARQRDGLLMKLRAEARLERERRDREPQNRSISIAMNGGPI